MKCVLIYSAEEFAVLCVTRSRGKVDDNGGST